MTDLDRRRRFFAEELEAVCKLQSPALVDAFAAVPREQFLRPGPWTVMADLDFMGPSRTRATVDADPARVYHNIAVAIDPARQLFNGQPGTLAVWIDALGLEAGYRVLHVGCGLGYYAAVMAHAVGPSGRVVAFEVDETLAAEARRNLASLTWVDARHGDAAIVDGSFDAILVNAGVTHPLDAWLDALADGGRMILPLTSAMPAMGTTLGKGLVVTLTKHSATECAARLLNVVAVYSAVGLRDEAMNERLGKALMGGPVKWGSVKRLRRDQHDETAACWLHGKGFCLSG
ncbi:MAG: methyltransferase domain-containing protein [Acidobacteria bacterium]|nr:methyltransferase domain-containing protein [Acidobacteriota bacterium]